MEKYLDALAACPLFAGIEREEILPALKCLGSAEMMLPKGKVLFHEGDPAGAVGIVLSGQVQVYRSDSAGKRIVLLSELPGAVLWDALACSGAETMPASTIALQDSRVLLINYKKFLDGCEKNCPLHGRIVRNMFKSISDKNLMLNKKIYILTRRTTREKVLAYLLDQAQRQSCSEFTIPHDRQSLADYLGVDRSAMSVEIGKLKKDGIIDCKGSWFRILRAE